jgi:hypothetical protein
MTFTARHAFPLYFVAAMTAVETQQKHPKAFPLTIRGFWPKRIKLILIAASLSAFVSACDNFDKPGNSGPGGAGQNQSLIWGQGDWDNTNWT